MVSFTDDGGEEMAGIKKPAKPKKVKEPKKAIKEKPSREIKKLARAAKKADKVLKKNIDRKLAITAVLLALTLSVLDMIDGRLDGKIRTIKKKKG